jgi:TonB family protein
MPLRCLLFSSNEEMVQPIWQVLTDLGIEGEYCSSAVDAVERVTTQLFQIVITDWEDQPEATFLLKTARDQKASQRPLTLAIVNDDAKLPEALQAGANSILLRPIRPEQVRDTLNTACQLLRSKQPAPARPATVPATQSTTKEAPALAAAAAGAASTASTPVPQEAEKAFRAGEFLQSPSSTPGAQFDTECEVQKSMDQAAASQVDALTELEPMAAAVDKAPPPAEPRTALDGWASLQARLKPAQAAPPEPVPTPSAKNELLGYGETPSVGSQSVPQSDDAKASTKETQETEAEAALFSYISGDSTEASQPSAETRRRQFKPYLIGAFAVACLVVIAMPRTRGSLLTVYRRSTRAGRSWLNPQPAQIPATVTQHETFEQDSNEYKFPVATNIPDATTDPSQIRVVPVVDPTAKPNKGTEGVSPQTVPEDSAGDQVQVEPGANAQPQIVESQVKEQAGAGAGNVTASTTTASAVTLSPPQPQAKQSAPDPPQQPQPRALAVPVQISAPPRGNPAVINAGIPSSLRSQLASPTPESSGNKPPDAAMSSIEPVNLPASALPELVSQPAEPDYPDAAKASSQRGSVVLQVLIGRDGTVQDAKFLQGSFVFARAAIDAVKQWRFKPYLLNGRAVSVQSTITLNFKPPA